LDHGDTSRVALALARQRLMGSKFPYFLLADSPEGRAKEQALTGQPLPISESRGDIRQGFVYERVQHITLKSIANNPDIREGMSRDEIDAAIKRHADFELLYDKPYEDKHKVRVTGPFTVESLSPHRSIAFAGQGPDPANTRSEAAAEQATAGDFEQMILDNLRKAGIQNGRRNERLKFANIDAYPGIHVHAIGEREVEDDASPKRVGIVVGPQYGTVGSRNIMDAAKEAVKAKDIDLLVVLAFAFDPQALGSAAADGTATTPAPMVSPMCRPSARWASYPCCWCG
jgi:adenine-specific DNA-methyltransferase